MSCLQIEDVTESEDWAPSHWLRLTFLSVLRDQQAALPNQQHNSLLTYYTALRIRQPNLKERCYYMYMLRGISWTDQLCNKALYLLEDLPFRVSGLGIAFEVKLM